MGSFLLLFLFLVVISLVAVFSLASARQAADQIAGYSEEIERVATLQSFLTEIAGAGESYLESSGPAGKALVLRDLAGSRKQPGFLQGMSFMNDDEQGILRLLKGQYDQLGQSLKGAALSELSMAIHGR